MCHPPGRFERYFAHHGFYNPTSEKGHKANIRSKCVRPILEVTHHTLRFFNSRTQGLRRLDLFHMSPCANCEPEVGGAVPVPSRWAWEPFLDTCHQQLSNRRSPSRQWPRLKSRWSSLGLKPPASASARGLGILPRRGGRAVMNHK